MQMMASFIAFNVSFSTLLSLESLSCLRSLWPPQRLISAQMGTIVMPSIILALILQTTPNRCYSQVSFSFGAQSKLFCSLSLLVELLTSLCRCLTPKDKLDHPDQSYCCREHTNLLIESWLMLKLWDEYGIVDNVKVSFSLHIIICICTEL